MGQFSDLDYDYSIVSLDEGYRIWRENEGRRVSIGYGYTCRGKVTPGPHWTGRWVATGGMGNCGVHVIAPVSREARKLVRMHVTECWVNRYGISYREADSLYGYRGSYKYELIEDICAAINDEACHDAFLRFPGVGPRMHHDWIERWGDVVASYCTRSWPRNSALIEAVNHVIRETSREFQSA
jgi:hypothetical protein